MAVVHLWIRLNLTEAVVVVWLIHIQSIEILRSLVVIVFVSLWGLWL